MSAVFIGIFFTILYLAEAGIVLIIEGGLVIVTSYCMCRQHTLCSNRFPLLIVSIRMSVLMKLSSSLVVLRPSLHQLVRHRYTSLLVLIVLIGAAGYWGWHKFYGKKDPHEIYQVAKVQRGDIEDLVSATGTVQPLEYVDVGAQVSGQLKKLHIEVGSVVKEGDLLAEIDPTVFLATVDARRAGLRNQLATMKDREAQLALAQLQYSRQKNLMAADATTKESLQTAEATLRSAKAQIEALQAQIEQTQSTLRADEANLNYAKIYAPMAGTVVSLTARQGQTLNANQSAPTILRVADLSTMTVQTQVSEAEVGKLRQGMEVYFTTLGSQGRRWYGKLRKVEPTPTVTNNVVLYNALFDVPNQNQVLMPSMTTQVFFIAATAKNALLVPTAAVALARGSGRAAGNRKAAADKDAAVDESKSGANSPAAAAHDQTKTGAAGKDATAASDGSDGPAAKMTPEQRRAAFEKMTPEERQAIRERRRALREAAGKSSEPAATPSSTAKPAGKTGISASVADKIDPLAANSNIGSPPVENSASSGFAEQSATPMPRRGTVKVIDGDGKIAQRKVELGVTNRVQMQILSGLAEGDEVVIGLKPVRSAKNAAPQGIGQQSGVPRGMGGGRGR